MSKPSWTIRALLTAGTVAVATLAGAQTLRFGLAEDPDILDPTLARTFVGRIVFAALCDKLFDIDEKLDVVPQLATGYEWSADRKALTIKLRKDVTFHDGEKLDAAAVKFNIERHKTMAGSNRRGELAPVTGVDVVDDSTVRLNLSAPFAPLLAQLADRAGMMVSPKAAQAEGDKFGSKPVCSGPFRFVERVAQDRIVLERYPNYWNKGEIHFDKIVYLPIVDATVRLANLKSGQLDFIERVGTSDIAALKTDSRFKISRITEIGYQGITINVGKSDLAQKNPLGRDPRVREAFELTLDRDGIAQVAMDGEADIGNQWVAPTNAFYAKNMPVPKRDVAKAKALLQAAGVSNPSFTLMTPTTSDAQKIAQVVRIRDLAQHGRQGRLRGVCAGVERARRSGRECLQLPRLQAAARLRRLLQAGGRRSAQPVAHHARPGGAQEDLRRARSYRAQGQADRVPLPPPLAVGVHQQAFRPAHDSGRAGAGAGVKDELTQDGRMNSALRNPALFLRIHSHAHAPYNAAAE
jgi:peptide/nickel transport system substrate-binding protein